jgi:hypothetical protein
MHVVARICVMHLMSLVCSFSCSGMLTVTVDINKNELSLKFFLFWYVDCNCAEINKNELSLKFFLIWYVDCNCADITIVHIQCLILKVAL